MKIYLDDVRPLPSNDWTPAKSWWEFKKLLNDNINEVTEISFDHDLGDQNPYDDGTKCINYLEMLVVVHGMKPPVIHIHTANPAAASRMRQIKERIESFK